MDESYLIWVLLQYQVRQDTRWQSSSVYSEKSPFLLFSIYLPPLASIDRSQMHPDILTSRMVLTHRLGDGKAIQLFISEFYRPSNIHDLYIFKYTWWNLSNLSSSVPIILHSFAPYSKTGSTLLRNMLCLVFRLYDSDFHTFPRILREFYSLKVSSWCLFLHLHPLLLYWSQVSKFYAIMFSCVYPHDTLFQTNIRSVRF